MNLLAPSLLWLIAALGPAEAPTLERQLAGEDPAVLARDAKERGDAARGALLFHQQALACARCHVADDGAKPLGPDLATIGRDVTDAHLIESILAPSKVVEKGYETFTIARADGVTITGLLADERPDSIVLRDPANVGKLVTIARADIDARDERGPSIMPAGLVNQLSSRQQFLDLLRYLREVADGGPDRARELRPSPAMLATTLPAYEKDLDHAGLIADLGPESFARGEAIYGRVCINCHGTRERPGSLPSSPRFASATFKNGSDPYSLYRTLTHGFGRMAPQTWMVPRQKYDVIHYLREAHLKDDNPTQFVRVDRDYLDRLPKGTTRGPEPSKIEPWAAMDYGPSLAATYEIGDDGANFAYKGIAVRLDEGPGGVSRGGRWSAFEHDTMRLAAAWSGEGFIDWEGINFNGRHGVHPRVVGRVEFANPAGPGWANPQDGSFQDPRPLGRDGRPYGPLPRPWARYLGQYRHGGRVVVSYTVGDAKILEMPGQVAGGSTITRTFHIGPRNKDLVLQVARGPAGGPGLRVVDIAGEVSAQVAILSHDDPMRRDSGPLEFRGATSLQVEKPDDFDLSGGDYSIVARVQTRRGGSLFCETSPGKSWVHDGKSLFIRDGRLVFDIGWVGDVSSRRRIDDGAWHDVAMTWQASDGRVRLSIDGQPDGEKVLRPVARLRDRVLRIGFTAPDFPTKATYFDGRIGDLRFYRRALRPEEMAEGQDDRLLAHWRPDACRGDVVKDETGRGHDGKVEGPPTPAGSILAGVSPPLPGSEWRATAEGDLRLKIPAGEAPSSFVLGVATVAAGADLDATASTFRPGLPTDLAALTHGGDARWPERLKTAAKIGDEAGPFAVDTLELPDANPWLCQVRPTGFDFLPGGKAAAVCTWDGDVWLVDGIDDPAGGLTWRRIASGLFQPLGLKVLNGVIFVGCRDQIAALRDLNGDGEADFIECFNGDHQVTEHFHEFAMGLQADAEGNFYYAKSARHGKEAVVPQHGTLLRVARDGSRTDILATGFRAPNGICLNPDGTFFLTDQEGFWTPKNRLNWVKPGGFYGNMWGYHDIADPSDLAMEQPLCWLTNAFDRSPAEMLRVDSDAWGPLKGALLNLSYGEGKVYVVPHEVVGGQMQGGACALPIPALPTGVMRGRFHPGNGQLYACGMFAWAGNRIQPGGLYRLRYTGKPVHLPLGLKARPGGMEVTFSGPLDREAVADFGHFAVKTWSLKRSAAYGSAHLDERARRVVGATPTEDGRGVFLEIEGFGPTQGMEIQYSLRGEGGEDVRGVIHNTVHRAGE